MLSRGDRQRGGAVGGGTGTLSIMEPLLLTVTNRVSADDRTQDEIYEFTENHQVRTFGRDDSVCDIVIWSAITGQNLARVAGEIWRWGDQLWLRNLSTSHELDIVVPGQPPEPALRRRRDDSVLGAACSLPEPFCTITAPGGCVLDVVQQHQPRPEAISYGLDDPTVKSVPEVPEHLRLVATALCEPLLLGHRLPAAYREVMIRTGESTQRVARRKIEELTAFYTAAIPELAARAAERKAGADAPVRPVRAGMIYDFEPDTTAATERAKALALPAYYDVARLLVRHYRITPDDLAALLDEPRSS
jgi:hypothetical protein